MYDQKWRSTLDTVGNLFYRGSKHSRKTSPTVHAYKTLHVKLHFTIYSQIFDDAMQAPRFMREKSLRELYKTCGLREALEDFARFLRDLITFPLFLACRV